MSRPSVVSDPFRFASEGRSLVDSIAVSRLERLSDVLFDSSGEISYSLVGERRSDGKSYFRLRASAPLGLQCQRCLQRMEFALELDSVLQLVRPGQEIPDAELENDEFDAFEVSADLDVLALLEEEILLTLPIAPRHEQCDAPRPLGGVEKESPFAALSRLRRAGT